MSKTIIANAVIIRQDEAGNILMEQATRKFGSGRPTAALEKAQAAYFAAFCDFWERYEREKGWLKIEESAREVELEYTRNRIRSGGYNGS